MPGDRSRDSGNALADTAAVTDGDAALARTAASDAPTPARASAPEAALDTLAADPDAAAITAARSGGAVRRGAGDLPTLPAVDRELYRIDGELARGGMGRILRARDRRLGRAVAIKESLAPGGPLAARFEREALITARLQHPAIVPVYEAGQWPDGDAFYVMKLVAGKPLDDVLSETRTFRDRVALLPHVIAACEALAYAHDRGIVHRDLKPGNVLVGDYGETVVVDWGLAKDLADGDAPEPDAPTGAPTATGSLELTAYGSAIGTPAYMPPEQARGEPVDARADVYALGALLYHLVAGAMPYAGARSVDDLITRVLAGPPPPVEARAPEVPRELAAIVARAMARDRDARYASAGELAADLRRFQTGQLVSAHRYTAGEIVRRWLRRHRAAVATAAALLVVLAVVAVISVRSVMRARELADARRAAVLEEQGRQELVAGRPARALPYLIEAWSAGRRTPALELLLADAMRTPDAIEQVVVHGAVPVTVVAPGPDGALATADEAGGVRLWRAGGAPGPALRGHGAAVRAIAWAPDGTWLATAGDDTTVRLWDAATGAPRAVLPDHGHVVDALRVSADGARLLSLGGDGIRLWAVDDGAPRAVTRVPGGFDAVFGTWQGAPAWFAWTPGDGSAPASIAVRAPGDGAPLAELPGGHAVALDRAGRWAVTTTRDAGGCGVQIVELTTGAVAPSGFVGGSPDPYRCAPEAIRVAGDALVMFDDTRAAVVDPATGAPSGSGWEIDRVVEPGARIDEAVVATVDGRATLLVVVDGQLAAVDLVSGAALARLDGHAGGVPAIAVAPDGERIVTGGDDGRAITWRPRWGLEHARGRVALTRDGARRARLHGTTLTIEGDDARTVAVGDRQAALDVAWDARVAVTAGDAETGGVHVWDLATGRERARLDVAVQAVALDPAGARVATIQADRVGVWTVDGALVATLVGHRHVVTAMAWRPDGGALVTASKDGTARRWDPAGGPGEVIAEGDGPVGAVAWARDGERVAIGVAGGAIAVVGDAGTQVLRGHGDTVGALAFDAAGRVLASGGADGTVRVWDLVRGAERVVIEAPTGVRAIALRDDGAVVATASGVATTIAVAAVGTGLATADAAASFDRPDGAIRVWDAGTGALLLEREGAGQLAFLDDGAVVARGHDLWRWDLPRERRDARALRAAAVGGTWALVDQRLIATATSRLRRSSANGRTFDFAGDEIVGAVRAPDDADAAEEALARAVAGAATPVDVAVAVVTATTPAGRAPPLEALATAYEDAGAPELAMAALDRIDGDLARRVAIRLRQAELAEVTDHPVDAAARLSDAIALAAAAGEVPVEVATAVVRAAMTSHETYAKTRDARYADAARALYNLVERTPIPDDGIAIGRQQVRRDDLAAWRDGLAEEVASHRHAAGQLDTAVLRRFIRYRYNDVRACYERQLVVDPTLEGRFSLEIEIDDLGRVARVTTSPPPGPAGLAAVATCVAARTRSWTFPRPALADPVTAHMPVRLRPE